MPELTEIKGVGPVLAKACAGNGYGSVEKIAAAMLDDLVAVPGISEAKAKLAIAAAQDLLNQTLNQTPPANSDAAPPEAAPVETKTKKEKSKKKKDKKKEKKKSKKDKKKKAKKKN